MAVSNTIPVIIYTADGVVTDYTYPFRILDEEDIYVYFDEVEQSSGYTVVGTGNATGGTIQFTAAPANGVEVKLQRRVSMDRELDYTNGGRMNADTFDFDMDRTVMMIQDERQWATDTLNYYIQVAGDAAAFAIAAEASADAASTSETNAAASEAAAYASQIAALNSQNAAAASASSASTSASNASSDAATAQAERIYIDSVIDSIAISETEATFLTGDGSTTSFTINFEIENINRTFVTINGIVQTPTVSYEPDAVNADVIVFAAAPSAGSTIVVRNLTSAVEQAANHTHAQYATLNADSAPYADNTYDLGSASNRWNQVYANEFVGTATAAEYADLAENFIADHYGYAPGTVVGIGGDDEITHDLGDMDTRVIGVVSENPAFLMNTKLKGDNVCQVAYTGRVPCKVKGEVKRGDMLVSAGNGWARAESNPRIGSVIGKALEDFNQPNTGVIEIVVGRC